MDISRRKNLILSSIVSLYTGSGDPVGSKILSEFLDEISVSTATLRNEMAELTSLGLLMQPHTSAGRVPTTEGYRYYVDNLLTVRALSKEERECIDESVANIDSDPDRAADEAARALAEITGLAAITTTPRGGAVQFTHFELIKTGKYNIAVLGITSVGGVKTRVCRLPKELDEKKIHECAQALNRQLCFVCPEDVSAVEIDALRGATGLTEKMFKPLIDAVLALMKSAADIRVYTDGLEQLLRYPELDAHIRQLLELFANTSSIMPLLEPNEPLKVFVGDEDGMLGCDDLGLVVGRYRAAGGRYGALAVAGPVRMNYSFIIPRVAYFRDAVSAILTSPGA